MHPLRNNFIIVSHTRAYNATFICFKSVHICYDLMYIITFNIKTVPINGKFFVFCIQDNILFPKIWESLSSMFKEIDSSCS